MSKLSRWIAVVIVLLPLSPGLARAQSEAAVVEAPDAAAIAQALARYRHEPSVEEVLEAALSQRTSSAARLHDAMDRARGAGWLPTARASIRRGQTVDLRGLALGEATNVSTDDALTFDASLTFRFGRIAYAPEEGALLRELRAVEDARDARAERVVAVYFERRRLQLERDLVGVADVGLEVRIAELTAWLNRFTAGAFLRMMRTPRGRRTT